MKVKGSRREKGWRDSVVRVVKDGSHERRKAPSIVKYLFLSDFLGGLWLSRNWCPFLQKGLSIVPSKSSNFRRCVLNCQIILGRVLEVLEIPLYP